jgi:hypothetical protein
MTVQHVHQGIKTSIFVTGSESDTPVYMGCVGRVIGESWQDAQQRWDAFAREMWEFGVQPNDDEPFFSILDDGIVWDHYTLVEIEQEDYAHPLAEIIEGSHG